MRSIIITAMVFLTFSAYAQLSPDEAMAKLKAKEAAATQPADVRQKISDLQIENAALKRQIADLQKQIADLQAKLNPPVAAAAVAAGPAKKKATNSGVATHDEIAKVKIGMTEDQVDDIFSDYKDCFKHIVSETATGRIVFWVDRGRLVGRIRKYLTVTFEDGKAVEIEPEY